MGNAGFRHNSSFSPRLRRIIFLRRKVPLIAHLMLKAVFWRGNPVLSSSDLWCGQMLESIPRFEFRQGDLIPTSLFFAAVCSTQMQASAPKTSQRWSFMQALKSGETSQL
jgi:hypothetical protein